MDRQIIIFVAYDKMTDIATTFLSQELDRPSSREEPWCSGMWNHSVLQRATVLLSGIAGRQRTLRHNNSNRNNKNQSNKINKNNSSNKRVELVLLEELHSLLL